jgi:hypothetical protein
LSRGPSAAYAMSLHVSIYLLSQPASHTLVAGALADRAARARALPLSSSAPGSSARHSQCSKPPESADAADRRPTSPGSSCRKSWCRRRLG